LLYFKIRAKCVSKVKVFSEGGGKMQLSKLVLVSAYVSLVIVMGLGIVEMSSARGMEGLIGGWLFDEGTGELAKDVSGNAHHGEVITAKWVAGKFVKALEFGPSESYVRVKHHEDFNLESYTIAAWVRCEMQTVWQAIITKTNGQRNYGMFVIPNDGGIHFSLMDPADTRINSQEKVADGNWHYAVMTVEDGTLCGYIDGKKEETDCGEPPFNDTDVTIGAGGGGIRYWLIGAVDEPAIFNRVLNEAEIKELMNKGLGGILALEAKGNLVICWGSIKNSGIRH